MGIPLQGRQVREAPSRVAIIYFQDAALRNPRGDDPVRMAVPGQGVTLLDYPASDGSGRHINISVPTGYAVTHVSIGGVEYLDRFAARVRSGQRVYTSDALTSHDEIQALVAVETA